MKSYLRLIFILFCLNSARHFVAQVELQLSLEEWKENPIALTPKNIMSLHQFGFLDSMQANTLTDLYFAQHLLNFYQLQGLTCFDSIDMSLLSSIAFIPNEQSKFKLSNISAVNEYSGSFIFRLSFPTLNWNNRQPDTSSHQYVGNDFAIQQKLQIQLGKQLKLTVNSAKDRGESLGFNPKQVGLDFIAASVFYHAKTPISKFAMGAYQFQWAQGLQLWSSRALGRSIDILQSVRVAQGLASYNGTDEQRYLRGLGVQWKAYSHEIFAISSRKLIDVPLVRDSLALSYNSTSSSGYHRTILEIQRKKQIQETILGFAWQHQKRLLQMGSMLLYQSYSATIHTDSLGRLFLSYSTPFLLSAGFHLKGNIRQSYCFLEVVQVYVSRQNLLRSNAAIFGVLLHLHSKIQLSVNYRYYGLYYRAFYEQGFHARSIANNEQGVFLNVTLLVHRKVKWQTFIDQYHFKHLTPTSYPQAHTLFRSQISFTKNKFAEFRLSYQNSALRSQGSWSLEGQLSLKRQLTIKTGIQISLSKEYKAAYSNFLTFQYNKLGNPWRLNFHLGAFMVPGQMSPHYQMNYHLGFGSATLQLIGQGYYMQTTTSYQINQKINLGIRLLWLSKNQTFEAVQQTINYQSSIQNLQFDLQFKYEF